MATRSRVKSVVRVQLRQDNPIILLQAGSQLEEMLMGDFYLTEKQVNEAIEKIIKLAINFPNNDLPDEKWRELQENVNLATTIKLTIDTTTNITAFAQSQG